MRIGKYEFGIAKGSWSFDIYRGPCGCLMHSIGPLYFTVLGEECG